MPTKDGHTGTADEHGDEHLNEHGNAPSWSDVARVAFVAACAALVWFQVWEPIHRVSVIGLVGAAVGGWPIFREAWGNIRERRMTMELSMAIALVAALGIAEFFTALVITAFVLAAEIVEGLTVGRGRLAIRELLDFLPRTVTVRRNSGTREVLLSELAAGDIALVAPGAAIPADGEVRSGDSYVDQATITGEATPVHKTAGAQVYAGTMNQAGTLEIVAERLGRDTSFGKIIEAVERAERSRAPVQKTADRYSGYLVYFALTCAALTYTITRDARSTISVIIVAGACGIAAGTPLAVLGAIGRAAREGAIIKGGRYLEALWSMDVVAFDKTGTVTIGAPVVCDIRPVAGVTERRLLEAAALAERRSEHPLSTAIVQRAQALGVTHLEPDAFAYTPGRGVTAHRGDEHVVVGNRSFLAEHAVPGLAALPMVVDQAASEIVVACDGRLLGTILVADAVRSEAREAVRELHALGIKTVLLTGDAQYVGAEVARKLGIDLVRAGLLPTEKVEAITELARGGHTVAMVGDGVNDAPALAHASIGVAMGSGTDVARESADIVLLGNELTRFVEVVRIARRARGIIHFNFVGTLTVDAVGVGLAAVGLLNPVLAALIHVGSEMTFILNSARLLPVLHRQGRR